VLAAAGGATAATASGPPPVALASDAPSLRFLDGPLLRAAVVFPRDRARAAVQPSTMLHPRVLEYARSEWRSY
jgi:spermidine synthase